MPQPRPFWPALALAALAAAGFGAYHLLAAAPPPAAPPLTAYYADAQGMFLVPASGPRPAAVTPEAWAAAVIDRLKQPPRAGLVAPVEAAATLQKAAFADGTWTVQIALPRAPGTTGEKMLVGAIVRTFVGGWPGARAVRLGLVDAQGKDLPSQHLDLGEPLTLADVENAVEPAPAGAAGLKSTLWWPSADGGGLVPVQLDLPRGSGIPPRDALERLMAGPPAEAGAFLKPVATGGLKASWGALEGGIARVELAGPAPDRRFVEATVLTLTEFPDVKAVLFARGGKPDGADVGPYHLQAPVTRPADVNGAADRP